MTSAYPRLVRGHLLCLVFALLTSACGNAGSELPGFHPAPVPSTEAGAQQAGAGEAGANAAGLDASAAADAVVAVEAAASAGEAGPASGDASGASDAGFQLNQDDEYLGLPAPAHGFRVKSVGVDVASESDVEYCEIAELPGTPDQEYIVRSIELANGLGSHHLVIALGEPGSDADKKLRSMKLGERIPCISPGGEFGLGTTSLTFTQSPYRQADMPNGIGKRLHGGQRFVFDYHYFNYSGKTIRAKSALAFHLIDKAELKNIASEMAFSNFTIDTPPGEVKVFKAGCKFKHDLWLMNLVRHTHQKSTVFDVWYEGGPNHGQLVWSSKDWEHDTEHRFPEPILMKAGQGFKFSCGFRNDGNKPLRMGTSASDEMCILNGTIWSPSVGAEPPEAGCTTTWIDADGVSHAADDYGGVPRAEFGDELACHAATLGSALLSSCVGCICGACGTPFMKCQNDPDCKPILDCTSAHPGDQSACTEEFMQHSSAVGMITAVGTCLQTKCPKECAPAPSPDAGAP